ncbi:hypothetical protein ACIQPR_43585 [Streptomyces sp. NPDC091280]|uniref:hypothetical protein n=1 Tax=Streptomyces sp. NPDC091280 TaxID=3365984 RepID=UPI00380647BA
MSAVKDFRFDSALVSGRAKAAAAKPDWDESFAALTVVFHDCGHLAGVYAAPGEVARLLVARAVAEWQAGRRALVTNSV